MIVLGLTGSIGMGKTTVAKLFADLDVPVFNSDEAVNLIYMKNQISCDATEDDNNGINIICKKRISEIVFNDKKKLAILEKFIHPLVREKQINFINESKKKKKPLMDELFKLVLVENSKIKKSSNSAF